MFLAVFISLLGTVVGCHRPVRLHFLDSFSLSNHSIEIFSGSPAVLSNVYLDFGTSECWAPVGGLTRFYCSGRSFVMDCNEHDYDDILLGLGSRSNLWSHFKTFSMTDKKLLLQREAWDGFDAKYLDCETNSNAMCVVDGVEVQWEHLPGSVHKHEFGIYSVEFFTNDDDLLLPWEIYASVRERFEKGEDVNLWLIKKGRQYSCGKGCLWDDASFSGDGRVLHAQPGPDGIVSINQRFQFSVDVRYDADQGRLIMDNLDRKLSYSFWTQILILWKVIMIVIYSTKKNACTTMEMSCLLIILLFLVFIHFATTPIDLTDALFITFFFGWMLLQNFYGGFKESCVWKHRSSAFNMIVLATLQAEVESYECTILIIILQYVLTFHELFGSFRYGDVLSHVAGWMSLMWLIIQHDKFLEPFLVEISDVLNLPRFRNLELAFAATVLQFAVLWETKSV